MDLTTFSPASALVTVIVIALAPFAAVMVTSFTKIIVVLSLLRSSLGLQQAPPNVVLNGIAIVLSIYVMFPVGQRMAERVGPLESIGGSTVGLMAAVTVELGVDALIDPLTIGLAAAALVLLIRFKINATWLIVAGGVIGLIASALMIIQ